MHYSELTEEHRAEFENAAINLPVEDWPKENEMADVVCSFGTVKVPYADWQNILLQFDAGQ